MIERALGTLARDKKGAVVLPPALDETLQLVANAVASWPDVIATGHWDLFNPLRIDGVDFYVGAEELGHIHLDGSIHLATSPKLGRSLVAEGLARPFSHVRGWVEEKVPHIGANAAVDLFRRNYEWVSRHHKGRG
jgi:Family of unknown function (DUF5519)